MAKSIPRILELLKRELAICVTYVDSVREGFVYSVENTELKLFSIQKVWAMRKANHIPAQVSLALVKLIYLEKKVQASPNPTLKEVSDWLSTMQMVERTFSDVHLIVERDMLGKVLAKYGQIQVAILCEEVENPSRAFFEEFAERQNGLKESIKDALEYVNELYEAVRDRSREFARV